MNKTVKLLLLAVVFIGLIAGAAVLYDNLSQAVDTDQLSTQPQTNPTDSTGGTEASNPAPDFTVIDADGNEHMLSDFFGKPIVLNFWASWCGPCQMEMPDFEATYLEQGDEIHFLMVNCTTSSRETLDTAKEFIRDSGYTFPVYYDTTGVASSLYGTYSIPMTFFIDAQGNLTAYAQGAIDADILQQGIDMIHTP